ncbi:uncharacterized protein PFL1_03525 [Pseudozyma flocculosa PF-1]|uniref:Zn(2)-C6 fungal-type domain-containing protein n=2 Tax=Pseudozyma flocculosa TaxID=84751 RepID=A0A5C3F725_9BASI|nr:uncharacterized protein PFL1_03525 [Pseudozyma flocculosa PF-1]EPQ28721.1 hypothetical protein PFL1_03525 [Pseudozyma flocculosa PF-1]SPO39507.1 uncharacterized protein PSFLO_04988 [Pseudozyma flocculosa]
MPENHHHASAVQRAAEGGYYADRDDDGDNCDGRFARSSASVDRASLSHSAPAHAPPPRSRSPDQLASPREHDAPPGIADLDPEQQQQITNAKKYTPSCARCRQKKLRCDTKLPCNQCTAKGLQNECRKDQRIPRGRKRPRTEASSTTTQQQQLHDHHSRDQQQSDEVSALKRRIQELEKLVGSQGSPSTSRSDQSAQPSQPRNPQPPSPSTSQHNTTSGASSIWPSGNSRSGHHPSRPTSPFTDIEDPPGEAESAVSILEKLAASDPRIGEPGHGAASAKKINDPRTTQISQDEANPYYGRSVAVAERIEILEQAKQILPEPIVIDELIYAFNLRCHHLVGHVIFMPAFRRDVDAFNSMTVAEILMSTLDMFDLARYLMVLRLGMRFYPWRGGLFVDAQRPEFIATDALKNRGDDISLKWYQLAKRALAADRSFSLGSLKAVQAALLMILDGRDAPSYLRMLLRISIQTALDMGLHRLGDAMPKPNDVGEDLVRIETGVRIWWYLVVKDWCSAQREGAYTVHPAQMTTRRPLHTNDDRLAENLADELPLEEFSEMSYVLGQISLAHLIRESIDLRNEQPPGSYAVMSPTNRKRMQAKVEAFLGEELPSFYRLDSTRMKPGVLAVQRCLLHQQSFDFLLKLNRKDLASPDGRAALTMLAEQIVSTQKLLRSVCPVIDAFWINFYHLFGATLTLSISLLLDEHLDEGARKARRDKVDAALASMRETPGSDRGSRIIETLLEEEERSWRRRRRRGAGGGVRWQGNEEHLAALTRRLLSRTAELGPSTAADAAGAAGAAATGGPSLEAGLPDESIIPAFCSSWNDPSSDPLSSLQQAMTAVERQPVAAVVRPYKHSLHPWDEPPLPPPPPPPPLSGPTSSTGRYEHRGYRDEPHRRTAPSGPGRPLPFHLIEDPHRSAPLARGLDARGGDDGDDAHYAPLHLHLPPDQHGPSYHPYPAMHPPPHTHPHSHPHSHPPPHTHAAYPPYPSEPAYDPDGYPRGGGGGVGSSSSSSAHGYGAIEPVAATGEGALGYGEATPPDAHLTEGLLLDWALHQGSLNLAPQQLFPS